jgi:hypothetical protein
VASSNPELTLQEEVCLTVQISSEPCQPASVPRHWPIDQVCDDAQKIDPKGEGGQRNYPKRWEIELVVDELDTHQRLAGRTLRSLNPVGVVQELYGLLLAHYAIRVLRHEAALEADLDPDRLSFVQALEVVRDAVPEFQLAVPEPLPLLYARRLMNLGARRLPERRPRSNPRVVKRKMSNFKVKRAEHQRPLKPERSFREAILSGEKRALASLVIP